MLINNLNHNEIQNSTMNINLSNIEVDYELFNINLNDIEIGQILTAESLDAIHRIVNNNRYQ